MTTYSCDWAHDKDKLRFYNGKKILLKPSFKANDKVVTENMPDRYAKILIKKGVEILANHKLYISSASYNIGMKSVYRKGWDTSQ